MKKKSVVVGLVVVSGMLFAAMAYVIYLFSKVDEMINSIGEDW